MKNIFLNVVVTALALPMAGEAIASADRIHIEEVMVLDEQASSSFPAPEPITNSQTDSASLLKLVPGANINSNGPISGVAQYRGLFGDRVAVSMDNDAVLSGGPNAMDAPLSYAPPLLLKSLAVTPGIVPVSASQEAIGGHIVATLDRGEFADAKQTEISGAISSRYGTVGDDVNHGLKAVVANNQHKLAALASYDRGNDGESGNRDKLADTGYRRERYDLSYAWQNDTGGLTLSGGKLNTNNTGTPALPMDIIYIHTDIANLRATANYQDMTFRTRAGYSHVDHRMDNFSLRSTANPMMYRQNDATGRQFSWSGSVEVSLGDDTLTVGIDGAEVVHDALITNPNMAMFAVQNFSEAERVIYGLFAQWQHVTQQWQIETGLRYNRVNMDSDRVSASGMMPMMQTLADGLAGSFNSGEREQSFDNIDIVVKASRPLTDTTGLNIGIARKTRAPSYQELYLWLPLEATGGLADGRSYIGNLDLDSEVNYEINTGLDWQAGKAYANAQMFFRKVDHFIQGTPSSNTGANMLATMMRGQAPLQFNNINAELYGFDGRYGLILNDNWRLDGVLSYVRGEDKDHGDNLYRLAPFSHSLAASWQKAALSARLESVLYAKQSKTSDYNNELETAGYGLLNIQGQYQVSQQIKVSAGIDNLLNKHYVDHLSGYNRNSDSDIALGEQLPGRGRNLFVAINISW